DRLALGAELAHVGEQRLILGPIVPLAREHVLVLAAERPAMLRGVALGVGELHVEGDAFAGLLVAADACVDQRHRDAERTVLLRNHHRVLLQGERAGLLVITNKPAPAARQAGTAGTKLCQQPSQRVDVPSTTTPRTRPQRGQAASPDGMCWR